MFRDYSCSGYECVYTNSIDEDCDDYDQWFCLDSNTRAYADYTCSVSGSTVGCSYSVTNQQSCYCSGGNCITSTTVHGYMKYSNGAGIPNVKFKLEHCSTGSTIAYDYTDNSGYYSINANVGNYILSADYLGYDIDFTDCTTFVGDISVSDIVPSASLSGYMHGFNGDGISNVLTKLTDCNGNIIDTDYSDGNGYFNVQSADAGSFDFYFTYNGYTFQALDCETILGSAQFTNPIVLSATLHGYLKDLDNNPLEGRSIELYDCSENLITSSSTSSTGYFSVTEDADQYKIMINLGGGWRIKLVDYDNNDCFFLFGDIDLGTLNINPSPDCSVFDYICYQGDIKLFGCYWDENERSCRCYGTECYHGCTEGLPECDQGDYGLITVDVDDLNNYPIHGAKVYLDNSYQGSTSSTGKYYLSAAYGYRNVKVNCPDNSYCDTQQVYVNGNEYLYFDCGCDSNQYGVLDIYVYNENSYPLVNVIGYINDEEVGVSNPFGLIRVENIPFGQVYLRLELYISKYDPIKVGYFHKTINIDGEYKTDEIIIRESELNLIDTTYRFDESGNYIYDISAGPEAISLAVVMAVIDIASVAYSATEFCKCAYNTNQLVGGAKACFDTLNKCSLAGMNFNECIEGIKSFSSAKDECFWEFAFLVGDAVSPLIPIGFIGGMIVKVGRRFFWVDNIVRFLGKTGDYIWKYTKMWGDEIVEFFAKSSDGFFRKGVDVGVDAVRNFGDEALEGWNRILRKGGTKGGKRLVAELGEEGAERLSRNIGELTGKGVKNVDSLYDEIGSAAKDLQEKILRGEPESAINGARGRLKGAIFEADAAANPKYIDNIQELRKPLTKASGEIDIVLKNGDIIEAKSWNFPISPEYQQTLRTQFANAKLEYPSKTLKFVFKNTPDSDTVKLLEKIGAAWEVLE